MAVKRDKDGHYMMIKGSIQEEDITVVPNVQIPEREERRPPRQHNWQKGEVYY